MAAEDTAVEETRDEEASVVGRCGEALARRPETPPKPPLSYGLTVDGVRVPFLLATFGARAARLGGECHGLQLRSLRCSSRPEMADSSVAHSVAAGLSATLASPLHAETELNSWWMSGSVAVAMRGSCEFVDKVIA